MRALVVVLCAALGLTLPCVAADSQDQNPQPENGFRVRVAVPGGWSLWNDSRSELIRVAYQRDQGDRIAPLVNIYNVVSGERRSIDVLKEFPNARRVYIYGLAGGPEGSVLLAGEVESNEGAFAGGKLLVYDNHSTLLMNLTAADYDVGAVAMDKQRNIYLVGTHDGECSSDESYPLVVKYDSQGHITLETLPRSLFANVDDPTGLDGNSYPHSGTTRIGVSEKSVHVYLAPVSEMVVLNQAGEIQKRVNVSSKLSEFAKTKGYKEFYVHGDEFSPSGDLWIVGVLDELSDSTSVSPPARNFVVRLTPEGQLQVPYAHVGEEPPGYYLPDLIGFTQLNEPVGSVRARDSVLVQKNPY
jgi:hypothetical protein